MKRTIVACDGTWDRRDRAGQGGLTNVAHMERAILPVAPGGIRQQVVYDDGVGGTSSGLRRMLEGGTGLGIGRNIREAYQAVCFRYEDGDPPDEVWLFGFSRGAYTVRSVVGMLRNCGIVYDASDDGVMDAYRTYRNRHHPDCVTARRWRARHSRVEEPRIRFVGVWDTVGALGIPYGRLGLLVRGYNRFHDVQLSSRVDHAYHAVAIDERRHSYQPTLWAAEPEDGQVVEQRWFPGVHRNVGGGYRNDEDPLLTGLSDAAFMWMADRADEAGLALDWDYVEEHIHPDHLDGIIADNLTILWRLRPRVRYIGDPLVRPQMVGSEARERHAHPPAMYQPENLVRYLADPDAERPGVVPPPAMDCRQGRCMDINPVTEPAGPNPPAPSPRAAP